MWQQHASVPFLCNGLFFMKKGCCVERKMISLVKCQPVTPSCFNPRAPPNPPLPPPPPTKKTKTNCYYPSWQIPLSLAVLVSHKGRSFAFSQVLNYFLLLHMKVTGILVMTHIKKEALFAVVRNAHACRPDNLSGVR